jgi:hypothetical protein
VQGNGRPWSGRKNIPWSKSFFRVAELESYLRATIPTKLSDEKPLRLVDEALLYPHDFLFVAPKRMLIEERNGGICDLGLYFSLGRVDPVDLTLHLGTRASPNLFTTYGGTDEERSFSLNSHSLRHLQTTELYRRGVSELLITKRFNRRTIAESRNYKHLTLSEDLEAIDVPAEAQKLLGGRAQETLHLIDSGALRGPLVDEFRRIQSTAGDDAALEFLVAEADGFHTTPYGYCLSSFMVEACPKHLECFNGCRYFAVSAEDQHRRNLERMIKTLQAALTRILELPEGHPGRENQLRHTRVRLMNIERALALVSGGLPFPDGDDRSEPIRGGASA